MIINNWKREIGKTVGVTLTVGLLASCGTPNTTNSEDSNSSVTSTTESQTPTVVATTTVLCDLTQRIAEDTIKLNCLLEPGLDPHVYEPLPEDRKAIENAELILYSGYGLEPELIKLIESTSNKAPKVAVAQEAVPNPLLGEDDHHNHEEDHSDHSHEQEEHQEEAQGEQVPDPHVWHNAQNGVKMVEVIEKNLEQLVPEQAQLYRQNAQALKTELSQIDDWIKSQIATIPKRNRQLITTHDSLGYYAQAYNIPVAGVLQGLSTEEKPTATRVKELVDQVKASNVPTIFPEVAVNSKLIETVAKDAQVKIPAQELYTEGLGEPGSSGDSYPKMLVTNTQIIVEGLGGEFISFQAP
ncbi:periplasmic solute binding protein [Gloeothece citriformis PCC 7424]|uniref:Periplasmic solute binding protein n=1 Tax=Gloeothece citriformis (strain PCC 7424) TaxID=65393 RepID=B7KKM1_GLOC7|nr:zinc ABC transporter substrate-binding protein [Gloeothece citriformis]ACK72354.1 periplasmic solute binding protein [Gloeothece citriformis PCC 7424]